MLPYFIKTKKNAEVLKCERTPSESPNPLLYSKRTKNVVEYDDLSR
jgi:hypothetical protein